MSRMSVTQRRELLLAAAVRVAVRDGVAELTTRAVAVEAGMPQSAFHYCFRSKDELLAEVVAMASDRLTAIAAPIIDPRASLLDQFVSALEQRWQALMEAPGTQLSLYELTIYAVRTPGLEALTVEQYAAYAAAAERFLDHLAWKCGVVWTVEITPLAQLFVATIDGLGLSSIADTTTSFPRAALNILAAQLVSLTEPAPA